MEILQRPAPACRLLIPNQGVPKPARSEIHRRADRPAFFTFSLDFLTRKSVHTELLGRYGQLEFAQPNQLLHSDEDGTKAHLVSQDR